MTLWYAEQCGPHGRWSPVTFDHQPQVDAAGRERLAGGIGFRLRMIRRVPKDCAGLGLDELQRRAPSFPTAEEAA